MRRVRWITVVALALAVVLTAFAFADERLGTDGPDVLNGTPGDDALYGRAGNDEIDGGAGNDDLDGGLGADDLRGGLGDDAVSYADRSAVTVTLDDEPDDGPPGERDNVHADVESLYGGAGADTLRGDADVNTLDGGEGNDRIAGGPGPDHLFGGPGGDTIEAADGAQDEVDCGSGSDIAIADRNDRLTGCEERRAQTFATATGTIRNFWAAGPRNTRVITLEVVDIAPGTATVEVSCRGGGCPFDSRTTELKGNARPVRLTSIFKRTPLRIGARVEFRITAPGALGKYVSYTMRPSKAPGRRIACLAPGSERPIRCP